jgi:two-component system, NarL family, response regulator DevR
VTVASAIRVFVVDDHEVVRRGVRELLRADSMEVVGESGSACQAARVLPVLRPDVAVLDVRLPDGSGIEVCRAVRALDPSIQVLMLTGFDDEETHRAAIAAGACGLVLKTIRGTALVDAIRAVAAGKLLPGGPAGPLTTSRARSTDGSDPRVRRLTPQEHRLVVHLAQGLTNRQIGDLMLLSEKTVKNYLTSAMEKLGMTRRTEVAVFSARHDWSL